MIKKIIALLAGLTVIGLLVAPTYLENQQNRVIDHAPYAISERASALHGTLFVADLHSDTLLWKRDWHSRSGNGHVDLPRLRAGNVAVQVFPTVTSVPKGINYDTNTMDSDLITPLAMVQLWPVAAWTSIKERALHQASRMHDMVASYPDEIVLLRTKADLQDVMARRNAGGTVVGALLAFEGAHPLEGELANIDEFYEQGFRMMGLQHFFDNELGGSLHGISHGGLTDFGKRTVATMVERGIMIDLAHSSVAVAEDVLAMTDVPLVVSHTGVKGACDTARNIPDDLMKRIASRGGVIGVGYWDGAVCDPAPKSVVKSLRYAIDLLGVDHVALGSDYDGATEVAFDTSELAVLTHEMLEAGFSENEIRAVMGGNMQRFLLENLPD